MIDAQALAGRLQARVGASMPTLASTRREWAPLLGRGQAPEALPELLAAIYALCGGAHRVAARHAVAAAQAAPGTLPPPPSEADRQALRHDTLREHLRRLWLDLPRLVPHAADDDGAAGDAAALAGCPWLQASPDAAAGRAWVEHRVLGGDAADWLAGWQQAPSAFAEAWCADATTGPAQALRAARPLLEGLSARPAALQAHASARELERLAATLRQDPGFALQPTWRGRTAETGTWTRMADRQARGADDPYAAVWMRLATRVADIARLVLPGGEQALAQGALVLEPGREGLGWCEMARGLLIHWVRLGDDGRVEACRVIAPTEWNFHPWGGLARLVSTLPPGVADARVRLLAAAYDPCVDIDIRRAEAGHA